MSTKKRNENFLELFLVVLTFVLVIILIIAKSISPPITHETIKGKLASLYQKENLHCLTLDKSYKHDFGYYIKKEPEHHCSPSPINNLYKIGDLIYLKIPLENKTKNFLHSKIKIINVKEAIKWT